MARKAPDRTLEQAMIDRTLKQQGVIQLRPEDLIRVVQNGRDKYLMVMAVTDYIRGEILEMAATMSPSAHDHEIADIIGLQTLLASLINSIAGKAPLSHVHNVGDIQQNYADAASGALIRYNGIYPAVAKATVSGGNAVFHFTTDGTSSGAAIFANGPLPNSELFRGEEGSNPCAYGVAVWSNGNKTLTVPVARTGATLTILGLTVLGANVAANGTVVYATAFGR